MSDLTLEILALLAPWAVPLVLLGGLLFFATRPSRNPPKPQPDAPEQRCRNCGSDNHRWIAADVFRCDDCGAEHYCSEGRWAIKPEPIKYETTTEEMAAAISACMERPRPQPDAPYGSKPNPDDAPVSRRELKLLWEDMEQFVNSRVGDLRGHIDQCPVELVEAVRDAIEKPVKKCGWCGGTGQIRLWINGVDGTVACHGCNGTGREDNNG